MFEYFSAMDISSSGLMAERMRMEVTANNIANANTNKTENGDPYRKQNVVFAAALDQSSSQFEVGSNLGGVRVIGIEADQSDFPYVHNPGHPDADENGNVYMSNVKIPNEMVDLITASRSYEANLRSMTLFKDMVEQTLNLLQGGR